MKYGDMASSKKLHLIISVAYLAILMTSAFFAIWGLVDNRIWQIVLGIPFEGFVLSLVHECGHIIACKLHGNVITEICILCFEIKNRKIHIKLIRRLESYTRFVRSKNDAFIFIAGPLASLVFWIVLFCFYFELRTHSFLVYMIIASVHLLKNCIPVKSSDMKWFLLELKRGLHN